MYRRNIYFLPLKQSLFYYSKKLFAYHYRLNIPTRYAKYVMKVLLTFRSFRKILISLCFFLTFNLSENFFSD